MLLELTIDTTHIESTEHLVHVMEIQPDDVSLPPYADIRDNRDVSVMRTYDPLERGFSEEQHKQSFYEEVSGIYRLFWLFKFMNIRVDSMHIYSCEHGVLA